MRVGSLVRFAAVRRKALAVLAAPPTLIVNSASFTRNPGTSSSIGKRTVVPAIRARTGPGFSRGRRPGGAYCRAISVQ